mgnify:CR=1 FL=1|tara:strand:- start:6867 stop:7574 length:708 start_codon:yes stop_codon:yes gene_type:complete
MSRDAGLDLIKWLAMLTMVVDHLRYLWPQAESWLFFIGRLAFPLFCLGIAANVSRSRPGQLYTGGNARYLIWLAVFSVVSELPYHMLSTESSSMNIMPTLMLGLLIAWSVHHQGRDGLLLGVVSLAVAFMLHDRLMYGAFGVLLPATLIVAIQRPGPAWLLPAVLCVLANSRNRWIEGWGIESVGSSIVAEFTASFIGLWLLRTPITWHIWPVRRWGYFFYPAHLLVLSLLRPLL